eukprot:2470381-Rhodomonas_salina.1
MLYDKAYLMCRGHVLENKTALDGDFKPFLPAERVFDIEPFLPAQVQAIDLDDEQPFTDENDNRHSTMPQAQHNSYEEYHQQHHHHQHHDNQTRHSIHM